MPLCPGTDLVRICDVDLAIHEHLAIHGLNRRV